jgi:hypothetical protein
MTKQELKTELLANGTESEVIHDLDDAVHEAASQLASSSVPASKWFRAYELSTDNGLDAQLDFLMDTCKWSPEDILKWS